MLRQRPCQSPEHSRLPTTPERVALNRTMPLILAVALFMENMDATVISDRAGGPAISPPISERARSRSSWR